MCWIVGAGQAIGRIGKWRRFTFSTKKHRSKYSHKAGNHILVSVRRKLDGPFFHLCSCCQRKLLRPSFSRITYVGTPCVRARVFLHFFNKRIFIVRRKDFWLFRNCCCLSPRPSEIVISFSNRLKKRLQLNCPSDKVKIYRPARLVCNWSVTSIKT